MEYPNKIIQRCFCNTETFKTVQVGSKNICKDCGTPVEIMPINCTARHGNFDLPPINYDESEWKYEMSNKIILPIKFDTLDYVEDIVEDIRLGRKTTPFEKTVFVGDRDRATLIFNSPLEQSDPHWHLEFDEWWIVVRGKLEWYVSQAPTDEENRRVYREPPYRLSEGDIIYVPRHLKHSIKNVGNEVSVRLAIATPEAPHIYEKKWVNDNLDEFKGV